MLATHWPDLRLEPAGRVADENELRHLLAGRHVSACIREVGMNQSGDGRSRHRVTLEDVAKHAHVSRALVSIVIRDAPGASSTTRERVWAAARELGYRPD